MEINYYHQRNKIVIKEAVYFYYKCWINCNEIFHSKEKKIEFVKKWYEKTKRYIELVRREAKKYADANKININNTIPQYSKDWIKRVQYFIKNQNGFVENDIRKYMV